MLAHGILERHSYLKILNIIRRLAFKMLIFGFCFVLYFMKLSAGIGFLQLSCFLESYVGNQLRLGHSSLCKATSLPAAKNVSSNAKI